MSRKVLIYGLVDPRSQKVEYVGKTVSPLGIRLSNHLSDAKRNNPDNARRRWLRELIDLDLAPEIILLRTCSESTWDAVERRTIARYRKIGEATANTHPGGQCGGRPSGSHLSPETRAKISEALRGRKPSEAQVRNLKIGQSRRRTPEERAQTSERMKQLWSSLSPEDRKRKLDRMNASRSKETVK